MYTNAASRTFFWLTSESRECATRAHYLIPNLSYDNVQIGYELRTPNPLQMSSGHYTGQWTYTVGPGMDFDMGDIMRPDDPTLTLSFNLDVEHTLKVDLPPGGNKVVLEPQGGWQSWIASGRKPARIFRDQMFYISASSRFKVMMQCNSLGSERCRMFGAGGNVTDVRSYLTLPAGLTYENGGPVNRYPLQINVWSMAFQPGHYLDRKAGMLHFEIPSDAIESLLKPGVSGTLSSNITILWDSEV
jgi:hypothetical protein